MHRSPRRIPAMASSCPSATMAAPAVRALARNWAASMGCACIHSGWRCRVRPSSWRACRRRRRHCTDPRMTKYVALLRAINVGGTGKLPMADLKAMCEEAGFAHVQTYIASGNVVFESKASEAKVKAALEQRLHAYAGKPMGVVVRTAAEMAAVIKANPFPTASPSQPVAILLDQQPAADALD